MLFWVYSSLFILNLRTEKFIWKRALRYRSISSSSSVVFDGELGWTMLDKCSAKLSDFYLSFVVHFILQVISRKFRILLLFQLSFPDNSALLNLYFYKHILQFLARFVKFRLASREFDLLSSFSQLCWFLLNSVCFAINFISLVKNSRWKSPAC